MAEFWENMKVTLYFMKLEDKYWGLFLIGLCLLIYISCDKDSRERAEGKYTGLMWIGLITSLICICPVTAYVLLSISPVFYEYYMLWHIVPAGVIVCVAAVYVLGKFKENRVNSLVCMAAFFLILFFAGDFVYTSETLWDDEVVYSEAEEAQVFKLLEKDMEEQGKEQAYLWGPYKIMADSRTYSAKYLPVYGKDIAEPEGVYSDTLRSMYNGYTAYEAKDSPLDNKEEQVMAIANCLNVFPEINCDYVIMQHPKVQGSGVDPVWIFEELGYAFVGETDTLQVFRRL